MKKIKIERNWENDKNDKQNQKGQLYYKNGIKYIGDFKNGLFDGKGIYYYNKRINMMENGKII